MPVTFEADRTRAEGVCPSGQRGRAVNPLAYAFEGSNPSAPNRVLTYTHPRSSQSTEGDSLRACKTLRTSQGGSLNDDRACGVPVDGDADLQFRLFDAATGGSQIGSKVGLAFVDVVNGLFTVQFDFGAEVFTGLP